MSESTKKESEEHISVYLEKKALEAQVKFLYFMIGLTFAILGLSIETTDKVTWLTQASWLVLLVSALTGIHRIEWDPIGWLLDSKRMRAEYFKSELEQFKLRGFIVVDKTTGKTVPVDNLIESQDKAAKTVNQKFKDLGWKQEWRYKIHRWSFVFGILGLAVDKIFVVG